MEYRIAKVTDLPQIAEFCREHSIAFPKEGLVYIAKDGEKLVGVIAAVSRVVIEPLICDNPLAAKTLFDMCIGGVLAQDAKTLWLVPSKEKLIHEGEKMGFEVISSGVSILEKQF